MTTLAEEHLFTDRVDSCSNVCGTTNRTDLSEIIVRSGLSRGNAGFFRL